MSASTFFDGWNGPLRIVVVGVLAYAALVLVLRLTGKRTLSKLNAFDLVITIALGSTLSTAILDKSTPLVDGLVALTLLVLLQLAVTWTTTRSPPLRRWITSQPAVLYCEGELCREAMRGERVNESELVQAIQAEGGQGLKDARLVILQSDGSLAVVKR